MVDVHCHVLSELAVGNKLTIGGVEGDMARSMGGQRGGCYGEG